MFLNNKSKKYEHVTIFKEYKGKWILIDFLCMGNLDIRIVDNNVVQKYCSLNKNIEYNIKEHTPLPTGTGITISCVNMVKLYLGIKEFSIFTPEELYFYLTGGKIGVKQKLISPFKFVYLYFKFLLKRLCKNA